MDSWTHYLGCLISTVIVEVWIVWQIVRTRGAGRPVGDLCASVIAVNLLSHPSAWMLVERGWLDYVTTEICVICFEGLLLAGLTPVGMRRAFFLSFSCNAVTIGLSAFMFWISSC